MDYGVLKTLMSETPKSVVISYDIGCQWHKNLWKRIDRYGPDLTPALRPDNVVVLVPKFHLPAHIAECQEEFSFNLETKVGTTDGEAPERGWAASNLMASSTKEMGPGSRHDTLDDHWGDANWRKCISIGKLFPFLWLMRSDTATATVLLRKIQEAVPQHEEHVVTLEMFSETVGETVASAESLKKWTESVEAWERCRSSDVVVPNPYVPTVKRELSSICSRCLC